MQIVAACDFYNVMCIGHIQKGIIKSDGEWVCLLCVLWACVLSTFIIPLFVVSIATELYWRVSRLRAMMSLSRLNLHFPEED